MSEFRWFHEILLGAVLSNIVILIGGFKFLLRIYRQYDDFWHRHKLMWLYYCKMNNKKPGRLFDERSTEDEDAG